MSEDEKISYRLERINKNFNEFFKVFCYFAFALCILTSFIYHKMPKYQFIKNNAGEVLICDVVSGSCEKQTDFMINKSHLTKWGKS